MTCPYCKQDVAPDASKCPHCQEWISPPPRREDEADRVELKERRLADAVQARVEKDLVRRYSWIGLIVAALTGGSVTLLVKSNVDSALFGTRQNLAAAEALQARSTRSLDSLDTSLERMKILEKQLAELSGKASGTEEQFKQLQVLSASLRQSQFSSSSDILKVTGKLELSGAFVLHQEVSG